MQGALMALYAPLGGGAEPQLPAAQALRLRQLLNKLPLEPADAQGRARFAPTETRAVRGGAQFEVVGGRWDVREAGGALLSQHVPALWAELVQAKALYARIAQKAQAGVPAGHLTPTRLAALQTLGAHWRSNNAMDQGLRGLMLSYNVLVVPREECVRLLYAPASAAGKRALREQLMDACRSFEELQAHRAWLAAGMPAATPMHQRGYNRLMTPSAAKDFFKPDQRQFYELSQVALYLPPVGAPRLCGFCTLDNFVPKERELDVPLHAAAPGATALEKLPYVAQAAHAALGQEAGAAGLARALSESAVEVNMVGFCHEPVPGTVLGRGMGMLLLLHSLLRVAGKRYSTLTMFPIWGAPADTEGFSDMDRLREPGHGAQGVPKGQAPDVPVLQAYHEVLGAQRCFYMDGHLNAAAHASEAAARAAYVQAMTPDLHGANAAKKARIQRALESFQLRSPPPWSMAYAPLPAFPAPGAGAVSEAQARALVQALAPYAISGNFAPSSDDKAFVGKNILGLSVATAAARARVQAWGHELRLLLADHKALDSRLHEYRLARGFPQPEDVCGSLLLLRLQAPELFRVAGPRAQPLMGGTVTEDADDAQWLGEVAAAPAAEIRSRAVTDRDVEIVGADESGPDAAGMEVDEDREGDENSKDRKDVDGSASDAASSSDTDTESASSSQSSQSSDDEDADSAVYSVAHSPLVHRPLRAGSSTYRSPLIVRPEDRESDGDSHVSDIRRPDEPQKFPRLADPQDLKRARSVADSWEVQLPSSVLRSLTADARAEPQRRPLPPALVAGASPLIVRSASHSAQASAVLAAGDDTEHHTLISTLTDLEQIAEGM